MTNQTALWTIMVYISGDSVLNNFAVESLKQLRDAARGGVTVEVLFGPNGRNDARRLRFDENSDKNGSVFAGADKQTSLQKNEPGKIRGLDMVAPETLTGFIDSVTKAHPSGDRANGSKRQYGLILWGHGTELLIDADQSNNPDNKVGAALPNREEAAAKLRRKYLTPARLRSALETTKLLAKNPSKNRGMEVAQIPRKLAFIGLDACSMSMLEVATELQDCADFMIASQDDVPDQSFPYEKILSRLKVTSEAMEASRKIPEDYKDAYRDYFPAPGPAVTNITLSTLNLQNGKKVATLLGKLAAELRKLALNGAANQKARVAIINARKLSRSFVLGLYVDIYDFCENLSEEKDLSSALKNICKQIQDALTVSSDKDALVLNNRTIEQGKVRCHGLSIYLPYLTDEESNKLERSLTVGGTGVATELSKNATTANLHKNATTANLHKNGSPTNLQNLRVERIAETEQDLATLTSFNDKTHWDNFISCTWSYILATEEPRDLDVHYSAEQCVSNLFSRPKAAGKCIECAA